MSPRAIGHRPHGRHVAVMRMAQPVPCRCVSSRPLLFLAQGSFNAEGREAGANSFGALYE